MICDDEVVASYVPRGTCLYARYKMINTIYNLGSLTIKSAGLRNYGLHGRSVKWKSKIIVDLRHSRLKSQISKI